MHTIRFVAARIALLASVLLAGCTFRPYLRESSEPALVAVPPCFNGDVCAVAFDSVGLSWTFGHVNRP
jgi:hypothetical protein